MGSNNEQGPECKPTVSSEPILITVRPIFITQALSTAS